MKQVFALFLSVLFVSGCTTSEKEKPDFYTSDLFRDVQLKSVYPDSKTFVDCTPKRDLNEIIADYDEMKGKADFDLVEFVHINFDDPIRPKSTFATDTTVVMKDHIT